MRSPMSVLKKVIILCCLSSVAFGMAVATRPVVARSAGTLCAVQTMALPWAAQRDGPIVGQSADRYGLFVFAHAKRTLTAKIVLASDTELYRISMSEGRIFPVKSDPDRGVAAVLVRFKSPVAIHHAYVEELGIDDAPPQECAALVTSTDDRDNAEMSSRLGSLVPVRWAETIDRPASTCVNAYTDATVLGIPDEDTESDDYGSAPLSAVVDVVVASDGTVLQASLSQKSGVSGIDAEAIKTATDARYKPATLLCAPVASEYLFKYEYDPHS